MEKKFKVSGKNGTFEGRVEVLFDYRSEVKEVHNRSTHDEENRTFRYHKVVGHAPMKIFESKDFTNKDSVFDYTGDIETKVKDYLIKLAESEPDDPTEKKLKDMGYK